MTKVPQFEALEPRILLSATPLPETTDTEAVNVDVENQANESEQLVNEIIFIDSKVEEADKLIDSLNRNLEVHYLNEEESGLDQINKILQDREGISAIHILSHGDSGLLRLGNSDINFDDLSASQESSLISLKSVLSESADILIYGCDFGAGEKGLSSLEKLSSLTGADVAASNDDTGAENLGGDWTLEVKHGEIESQSLSDTSNWQHLLALPAPGGVDSNLLFWAKADSGGTAWTDQSGNGVTITTNGTVNTGSLLNFNPTNAFDGTGHYETNLSINAGTHPDLAVISVYVPDVDNAGSPWGEDNGGWDRFILDSGGSPSILNSMVSTGTGSLPDVDNLFVANQANISTVVFDEDVADGSSVQVNGLQETSFTSNHGPETSNVLEIGALGVNNYRFDGRIAETIVYNQLLSSADDLKQIESYLAIKYGITLDSSFGSYLDSNGAAVYTFDGTYENDVTGIGKDNNSSLDQRISKSVNSGSILTISTDTDFTSANSSHTDGLTDGQYLIAANNGGDTSLNASEQLNRQWRVENTGSVGAVNLKFDGFDSTYALVTNTDNDFSTPNTLVGYLNASGEISGVTLADNTYFTLVKSTAVADTDSATEASGLANGTAGTNATGNVLTNDIHSNGTISQAKENTAGTNAAVTPGTDSSDGLAVTGLYGTLTIGADGSYSYVIDNDNATVEALTSAGSINDVFEYTFTDDTGETETALLTVTINGANDTPVISAGAQSQGIVESGASGAGTDNATITLTTSDVDSSESIDQTQLVTDGWSTSDTGLTYSKTGTYGTATLTIATGVVSYQLDNSDADTEALNDGENVSDSFGNIQVTDAVETAVTALSFSITGDNDAPVGVNDSGTNTGNVLTNDTDVDAGDTPATNGSVTLAKENIAGTNAVVTPGTDSSDGLVVTGLYGTLTIGADGSYSYVVDSSNAAVQALDPLDTLNDVFEYTLSDDGGLTDTALLTITISGSNDAPVGVNDTGTAIEAGGTGNGIAGSNATGNVLSNDTDIDGDDTPATNGSVTFAKENTAGTNAAVTPGTDSSDGLVVTGLYGTLTIGADGTYSYVVNDNNATVQALGPADSIDDVFEYTLSDDGGLTDTAILTITINGVNDAPTVNTTANDTGTEDVNITYSFTDLLTLIGAADVDNSNTDLTVKLTSISNASVDRTEISTGESVTFTPVADFNGNLTFNYSVDDGEAASSASNTGAATISLASVVDIADDSVTTAEDTPIIIDVLANDSFEGTTAVSIATHPANGTVVVNGDKTITYTPNLNYNGADSFTYTVTSGGVTETATVNLTVSPVADTPSLSVSSITVKQNNGPTPLNISAAVGTPGETLSVIVNNLPAGTELSAGTQLGSTSWRLSADQLAGLLITFPAEVHGAFNLQVTAISKDGASLASVTSPLAVNIIPFVTPEISQPIISSNDQPAPNLIIEEKPQGNIITLNEDNKFKEKSLIFFEESSVHFNLEFLSDDALNVITDIFFEFEAIDPAKIGNQEVAFDGSIRGEGIQDMKVYDISLLNPEESKFLYDLLFGESDEDEDELKDESSFFIEDAILEEMVPEKIELAVSQSYLDERVCLSDTLIGEFDCFKV